MPNDDLAKLTIDRGAEGLRRRTRRLWRWAGAAIAVAAIGTLGYRLLNPVPKVAVEFQER
jgi:hypothetical protein